jgi:predicted nucleic acid-binding protein
MPLPRDVFCDTSFFYACLDTSDTHHEAARLLVTEATAAGTALWATWDIASETVTLLRYRTSHAAALGFIERLYPRLKMAEYGVAVRARALDVFRRYGRERRLSACDAISFVVVSTLLGGMPCLSFDEDFRRLGLTVITAVR